ncbi:nucleosidase [Nocardioides daphniae]|uniref:Nucleosidase n=1 Tax=Nocardioides daphniae TaxID=402297 RepID=A0A4P7UB22_9ACTN|nr:nucleosidase [Nocardioides daphniae]QCC77280.1 nucleosidase [Nocardioides daphniae]GGD25761.1 nucleosidase [Nocardioides daphniae]
MPTTPRILVVSATEAEARYVPEDLPLVITGIGKTAAAARTARALAAFEDVDDLVVVNIGTAGALRDDVTGLHVVGQVLNHEISADALVALGYDPEHQLLLGEGASVLASGDVFVSDTDVRTRLGLAAHLVDMEGYAVAWTAREFGREAILVKHVSDAADDSAWDWPTVVDQSARVLGQWLEEYLAR